jgi:biopolymer transport protein ExbD
MSLTNSLVAANPFAKHLRRGGNGSFRKRPLVMVLMLTSMVDMFSMLVVFLLQTFSSSPEILITKGLQLPNARTGSIVREAPVVAIDKHGDIFLDQKLVAKTQAILQKPEILNKKLEELKQSWAKNNTTALLGEINLQADKEVPSTVVSSVMGILTAGQFESIQLAILSGAK